MPGYATANPYAARLVNSPMQTALAMATSKPATFYTVWLGANDVLGYATGGGVGTVNTGVTYPTATNNISSTTLFGFCYDSVVNNLARTGAKGALINIPDVTSIPYFTTVPYNPLNAADPNFGPQIATLNAQFAQLNQVFTALGKPERKIIFNTTGLSPLLIKDKNLTDLGAQMTTVLTAAGLPAAQATLYGQLYGQCRQATAADLMVLPSTSVIAKPNATAVAAGVPAQLAINGVTYPLEDKYVYHDVWENKFWVDCAPFVLKPWKDTTLLLPKNAELKLKCIYGDDWKTPRKRGEYIGYKKVEKNIIL
jgi:hypothetical protein